MEINYLKNNVGDTLSPVKNTETHALFQIIGPDARFRDVFFIAPLESKPDAYGRGTELHLAGGTKWEDAGTYVKGKADAMTLFEGLTPDGEKKEKSENYYNNL